MIRKDGARPALFPISYLCCSVYCLCQLCCSMHRFFKNVYCTTTTGCQPKCSLKIHLYLITSPNGCQGQWGRQHGSQIEKIILPNDDPPPLTTTRPAQPELTWISKQMQFLNHSLSTYVEIHFVVFQTEKWLIDNFSWKFNSLALSEIFLWQVIYPICQSSIIFIFYLLKASFQLNNTDGGIAMEKFSEDMVSDRSCKWSFNIGLRGCTEHQQYRILYCPTDALSYIKCRIIKNTLKIQKLLHHVSVHAGTNIREPKSVPS